jgi:hypothetical protein
VVVLNRRWIEAGGEGLTFRTRRIFDRGFPEVFAAAVPSWLYVKSNGFGLKSHYLVSLFIKKGDGIKRSLKQDTQSKRAMEHY